MGSLTAETKNLDHLGLIAAIADDLQLVERTNARLFVRDDMSKLSMGVRLKGLVLNGFGFLNRSLYLVPEFFANKPVDRLLGEDVKAEDLNDDSLGRLLDAIYAYGATKFYSELAVEIGIEKNLLGRSHHLDTTNFTLYGDYKMCETNEDATAQPTVAEDNSSTLVAKESLIKQPENSPPVITYGYAKSKRTDLKQITLSLVTTGKSAFPLWMEALDGNSSDKKNFHETIQQVDAFHAQLKEAVPSRVWVADSALYTIEKLKQADGLTWLTRVPETIKEARTILEKPDATLAWKAMPQEGYKYVPLLSQYGDVEQRWILVYSSQAYHREEKTLAKNIEKELAQAGKDCWHLGVSVFNCEADAIKIVQAQAGKYRYHQLSWTILPQMKFDKRGRQKAGAEKSVTGYKISATVSKNEVAIQKALDRKGRFILATNELDVDMLSNTDMLREYKEQSQVENGFGFLKDTRFMVSSFFLKNPKRIEALMVIMTLCLMTYNVGQHALRTALEANKDTLPNQLKKQIANPTLRWVLSLMDGIAVVRAYIGDQWHEVISTMSDLKKKIIRYFGPGAMKIYGLFE